jgi:CheY-like chemotaxis protein
MTPRASDRSRGWDADPSFALWGQALSASMVRGGGDRSLKAGTRDCRSPAPKALRMRSPRQGRGQRIVVVDDEADIVDILAAALRADGYIAETFTHPLRAFEYILASPPALVVTDLYMPDLSGAELVIRVRAAFSSLPIIIMSASANIRGLALVPAQGFLGKPFDLDELSELVAKLLHV